MQEDLCEIQVIGKRTRERLVSVTACLGNHPITMAGVSDASDEFRFVRLRPAMGVVLACFSGQGQVLAGGEWRSCGPGTAYVAPPQASHAYHTDPGERWGICWVTYEAGHTSPLPRQAPTLLRADPEPLVAAVTGLCRESAGLAERVALRHWAELIHLHVQRLTPQGTRDDRMRQVWEVVDADLAHPWSLTELAGLACLSGEHLRSLCQRQLGRSPMQHVASLRMQRAAALLRRTDETVEVIAQRVGYDNAFAFSTAFKRWLGLPPSHYRRETAP